MRLLTALSLLVLALPGPGWAKDTNSARPVAIVKSRDNVFYTRFVSAFLVESRLPHTEYNLALNEDEGKKLFEKLKGEKPPLIVVIGALAARLARELVSETPVLFAMVPDHEKYQLTNDNITGIALNIPLRQQLATLKILAPNTKNVGVMYNPRNSQRLVEAAIIAAKSQGLNLVTAKIASADEVPDATRAFLGTIDALWMVPDRAVMNTLSFRHLLKFTFKNKVPFFSVTPRLVEAGALVSLSPDFAAIGAQAGRTALKIVKDGVPPKQLPVANPAGLDLAVNLTTARRIGVECDIALEIFTFAATRRYPINVYK